MFRVNAKRNHNIGRIKQIEEANFIKTYEQEFRMAGDD